VRKCTYCKLADFGTNYIYLLDHPIDQGPSISTSSATTGAKESKDKNKTWKGKVAKQWKKMHHSSTTQHASYPPRGAIGKNSNEMRIKDCKVIYTGTYFS